MPRTLENDGSGVITATRTHSKVLADSAKKLRNISAQSQLEKSRASVGAQVTNGDDASRLGGVFVRRHADGTDRLRASGPNGRKSDGTTGRSSRGESAGLSGAAWIFGLAEFGTADGIVGVDVEKGHIQVLAGHARANL